MRIFKMADFTMADNSKCRCQKRPKIKNADFQIRGFFYFRRRSRISHLKIFDFFFLYKN